MIEKYIGRSFVDTRAFSFTREEVTVYDTCLKPFLLRYRHMTMLDLIVKYYKIVLLVEI